MAQFTFCFSENGHCNGGFQGDEGSFDMVDETTDGKKKKKKERQASFDQEEVDEDGKKKKKKKDKKKKKREDEEEFMEKDEAAEEATETGLHKTRIRLRPLVVGYRIYQQEYCIVIIIYGKYMVPIDIDRVQSHFKTVKIK